MIAKLSRAGAVLFCAALLSSAYAASSALAEAPLGAERARLLLTRAGFAPNKTEVARFAPLTQRAAVDRMLAEARTVATLPAPGWINAAFVAPRAYRAMNDEERRAERAKQIKMGLDLRGWWLREMVATPSPLTERMTLFWHNHFVSAQPKVRYSQLMYQQNVLLRANALGSFRKLLHAVAKDPAMIIYLDEATNRKGAPNENFAREVMELFTLGEGHYGENDIKEAARAYSGWSLDPDTGHFMFRPGLHDFSSKTVLGSSGNFDGDGVLDLLLQQPAASEFITRKLWLEFVSPQPDEPRIAMIAQRFRNDGYRIDRLMRELLMQPELVARNLDNALVKSPVELVVGLLRQSGGDIASPPAAAFAVSAMGQNLFSAPNVRGWPGGDTWINTQSLLARKQFLDRALSAPGAVQPQPVGMAIDAASDDPAVRRRALAQQAPVRVDAQAWLAAAGASTERIPSPAMREELQTSLLVLPPVSAPHEGALGMDVLKALVLDPVYQLK